MAAVWYPVIDYLACMACGTCVKKCSHDVYDKSKAPSPIVKHPESCIDHCHDCGNLCTAGAITYVGDDTGWTPPHGKETKPMQTCCCCTNEAKNKIVVDFLYLDLHTCERCKATDSTLHEAMHDLSDVLNTLGYDITVNSLNITSPEMAEQYRFVSSPTIRVNGVDICTDVQENNCKDCGDLCGSEVDCRVFVYEGNAYEKPPKAMIIDGVLKALYAPGHTFTQATYTLPENLKTFFGRNQLSCCDGQSACTNSCC